MSENMVESDSITFRKLEKKSRSCNYCGKTGHTKFECKAPRRVNETRCKICSHEGLETMQQRDSTCHCPTATNKCLQRFTGRKQLDANLRENPHLLRVIIYDIPTNITNVNEVGKLLMTQIGSGITWNQYTIERPWKDDPFREQLVRITFMDLKTKNTFWNKFRQKSEYKPSYSYYSSYVLPLKIDQHTINVRRREDLSNEENEIFGEALKRLSYLDDVKIYLDHNITVSYGKTQWFLKSKEAVEKVRRFIEEDQRKPASGTKKYSRIYIPPVCHNYPVK